MAFEEQGEEISLNQEVNSKRIFHSWDKWEDYQNGFYENCSGAEKTEKINKVIEMFNSPELTRQNMFAIVNNWTYSCEHNLTNPSLNKIAYIGQAACCLYAGIPNSVTMEAWSLLSKEVQERANADAQEALDLWNKIYAEKCQSSDLI